MKRLSRERLQSASITEIRQTNRRSSGLLHYEEERMRVDRVAGATR